MVVVRITLIALPEKQLEVMQTLLSMIEPTAKEKGCLNYTVCNSIEDPNCFSLLEEWETREDLDRHIRSHRFEVLLGTKTLLRQPLEVRIHTVQHSEGIEAIHAARAEKAE